MELFKIEIREFLSEIIEISAIDVEDAISKVKELYKKEEIVLDYNNCVATEIDEYIE